MINFLILFYLEEVSLKYNVYVKRKLMVDVFWFIFFKCEIINLLSSWFEEFEVFVLFDIIWSSYNNVCEIVDRKIFWDVRGNNYFWYYFR